MTQRLTMHYSEIRSQAVTTRLDVRARFELPLDGPPCRDPGVPTQQPAAHAVVHYPQGAAALPAETENDT